MSKATKHLYEFGPFRLDTTEQLLSQAGAPVSLPPKIFDTLKVLVENSGRLLEKDELMKAVWPDVIVEEVNLAYNISLIRKVLGESSNGPKYIETVPKRGYRFVAEVREVCKETANPVPEHHAQLHTNGQGPTSSLSIEDAPAALSIAIPPARERSGTGRKSILIGVAAIVLAGIVATAAYFWFSSRAKMTEAGAAIRSLAVLPLVNLSGDPEQEYFADGMTEALITDLAKIGTLQVISRTSVMQYKGAHQSLPEIARELHVDAVIEGSVLRVGDRVRIMVQLLHAPTDHHLWAETYDRDLRHVLTLQSEVAQAIAREIKIKLTAQDQQRLASAQPVNREAYEVYLKGRYHFWERWSKEGMEAAIQYFEQAIEKDPSYAPAYAGLANCYSLGWFMGKPLAPREIIPKAKQAAAKALALDDRLAEAHTALATILFRYEWNWPAAEREYKRAIDLNPNDALAHQGYAVYLAFMMRPDEAMAASQRAQALDPRSISINQNAGWILVWARRYDQAIEQFRKAIELDPKFVSPHFGLADVYWQKGMHEEAIVEHLKARTLRGDSPKAESVLREAYRVSGPRGYWQKLLEQIKGQAKRLNEEAYNIAIVYARLGEKNPALVWLETAYEDRSPLMPALKIDARFDSLRSDPRFADLVRRVGLPP